MKTDLKELIKECEAKEAAKRADFHMWIESKIFEAKMSISDYKVKHAHNSAVYTDQDWLALIEKLKALQENLDCAIGLEDRLIKYFEK
jgi:regulator of sigma D